MFKVQLSAASYHFAHNLRHDRLCAIGSFLHFLVAHLYRLVFQSQVGDDADAEGLDSTVVGNDDFGNRTHAYGIAAETMVHLVFSRCLEGGALHANVHPMNQSDSFLCGYAVGKADELSVIGFVHVGKTGTRREVLSAQGMFGEEVDMVGNDHEVADVEFGIHATGGIADEERLDAQFVHDTYGEGDLFHGISLVVMESALHRHDILAAELSENQFAAVAFYGGDGEVGNILIGELVGVSYF